MNYLFLVLKFLIVCTPEYHLKIRKGPGVLEAGATLVPSGSSLAVDL